MVLVPRVRETEWLHRADPTVGLAGGADERAEIHQGLIKVVRFPLRDQGGREIPETCGRLGAVAVHRAKEDPLEQPFHVGIKDRGVLAEGKAHYRAGGVAADSLERLKCPQRGRDLAAVPVKRLLRDGVLTDAPASSSSVGYLRRNSLYLGMTRSTWVCCSITSETRILYGSEVFRHGRSRRWRAYQRSSRCWNFRLMAGSGK